MNTTPRASLPGLVGVCAAFLPPEAGGPDAPVLARRIEEYVVHLPATGRSALRAAVVGVQALSLATTRKRLEQLDVAGREAVLDRLASSRYGIQARDALKAVVVLVAGGEGSAADLMARGTAAPPVRPDPPLDVTPSAWWPSRSHCDVVVVGSGAGGAMAARTLARAGLSVVVVEEGRRWSVEEFRNDPPLRRLSGLLRDGGASVVLGRPPIMLPIGRGVGGTTLVNSGTCFRTPERVLKRWRDDAGFFLADPDAFGPWLDDVEATLEVGPVPLDVMGNNGKATLRGAEALGWSAGPLVRNAPGCDGCGQCALGCPHNAKAGVHLNALPQAYEAGARIVSDARVDRLLHEGGRVTGVVARRPDGSRFVVDASRVVLAAGATETPPLLRRSGLGRHPELGRNLALHPALSVAGRMEEPVRGWHGVLQSAMVDQFHESEGIILEATSTPPGLGSILLPGHGRELLEALADSDHFASIGAMIADESSGRVLGRSRPVLAYQLTPADGGRLLRSIEIAGRVLLAAGATEVWTGIPGAGSVRSTADLEAALAGADFRGLHLAAFHPTGTARAGADSTRYPVDPEGRLRGIDGVWLADASVLPTCPEVNPQVSIMAAALAIAGGIK